MPRNSPAIEYLCNNAKGFIGAEQISCPMEFRPRLLILLKASPCIAHYSLLTLKGTSEPCSRQSLTRRMAYSGQLNADPIGTVIADEHG